MAGPVGNVDVVVVGAGPVGLALAIDLAQRGVRPWVVEKHQQPQHVPKGQNLTQRTMEVLSRLGVEDEIRRRRPIPQAARTSGGLELYEGLFSKYQYEIQKRSLVTRYYSSQPCRIPQYETEAVLRARAQGLGVGVEYGCKVVGVRQDRSGVYVEAESQGTGARHTLQSAYVVGCDGGRSLTREQAGIVQAHSQHDMKMVLIVFKSEALDRMLQSAYPGRTFFNVMLQGPQRAGYWFFFGRVGPDHTFFFHAPVPRDATKEDFDFKKLVCDTAKREFELDISYAGFWDMRVSVASTYRNGRIFLAGDAAHTHPPYGGYGINTGFEDARNLAWKLAGRLNGWGGEALLHSYTEERRAVFRSLAEFLIEGPIYDDQVFLDACSPEVNGEDGFASAWRARGREVLARVDAYEPHYDGSCIVGGINGATPSAVGYHSYAARPGHHLAPARFSWGEDVFGQLGPDFTLIALGVPRGVTAAFGEAAGRGCIPIKVIHDIGDGDVAEHYRSQLVLVRPDGFVAWSGGVSSLGSLTPDAILRCAAGVGLPHRLLEWPRWRCSGA